jgi:hypothetical protein
VPVAAETAVDSEQNRRGAFRESRRGWGHLPQRDREELLQGIVHLEEPVLEVFASLFDFSLAEHLLFPDSIGDTRVS